MTPGTVVKARPAPRRPPDGRRGETLERLRVATIELGAEVGIDAMTVEEVALRAGVAKGTVYYNVRDKNELVRLAFAIGLANLAAAIDLQTADRTLTPEVRFEALLRTIVRAVTDAPGTARLLFAEAWRTGRPWYADLLAGRRAIEARIADLNRELSASQPEQPDPGILTACVLATAITTTLDQVAAGRTADEDIADHTATLVDLFRRLRAAGRR